MHLIGACEVAEEANYEESLPVTAPSISKHLGHSRWSQSLLDLLVSGSAMSVPC